MKVQELFEAGEVAIHDKKTPPNRDADYVKKEYGLKVGTIAHKYTTNSLKVGDWVRIDDGGPHQNEYGFIASKSFESDEPYTGAAGAGNIWKLKIDISKGGKPEFVDVDYIKIKRNKKWDAIESFTSTAGAAGAKAAAKNATAAAKKAAKASTTEMPTSVPSYVYP